MTHYDSPSPPRDQEERLAQPGDPIRSVRNAQRDINKQLSKAQFILNSRRTTPKGEPS